jgi:hypothetical protein
MLYVCMYVCMYMCMCVFMYVSLYVCMCALYIYICVHYLIFVAMDDSVSSGEFAIVLGGARAFRLADSDGIAAVTDHSLTHRAALQFLYILTEPGLAWLSLARQSVAAALQQCVSSASWTGITVCWLCMILFPS